MAALAGRDTRSLLMKLTETLFVRAIPHVHEGIGSTRCKRPVLLMEGNGIDRKDILDAVVFRTVTLEGVFLLLNFWIRIEELHCHATFDRAENVALLVRKATNASRLILQIRLAIVDRRVTSDFP